ncbi:hypothetical protein OE88DRAFT_319427 [Heliocybe sulcata]|uniref:Uncharacterized protein n=1 Tax=Heliocybe sulcata TaxID=5364 RepID=A0A5C3MX41_9AGAM|nr:hypothetical protein OE88DRAFT_319427 [Heliocybe sulcata]
MDFGILSSAISLIIQGKNAVDNVDVDFADAQELCREVVELWDRIDTLIQRCETGAARPELRQRLAELQDEVEPLLLKCRQILQWKERRGASVQIILRFQGEKLKRAIKEVRTRLTVLLEVHRLEETVSSGITQDEQTGLLKDLNQKLADVLTEMRANRSSNNPQTVPIIQVQDDSSPQQKPDEPGKRPRKRTTSNPVLEKERTADNLPLTPFRPPPRPASVYGNALHTPTYTISQECSPWNAHVPGVSPCYPLAAPYAGPFHLAQTDPPWSNPSAQSQIPYLYAGPTFPVAQPYATATYLLPPSISIGPSLSPPPWENSERPTLPQAPVDTDDPPEVALHGSRAPR